MTDREAAHDEDVARAATHNDREYTQGWRDYLAGRPCPRTPMAKIGWNDAHGADQIAGRDIRWSAGESELADWKRAETDRDRGPEANQ